MKLHLPHRLQAAVMAAIASVSFSTVSSATLAAGTFAFFAGQASAEDLATDSVLTRLPDGAEQVEPGALVVSETGAEQLETPESAALSASLDPASSSEFVTADGLAAIEAGKSVDVSVTAPPAAAVAGSLDLAPQPDNSYNSYNGTTVSPSSDSAVSAFSVGGGAGAGSLGGVSGSIRPIARPVVMKTAAVASPAPVMKMAGAADEQSKGTLHIYVLTGQSNSLGAVKGSPLSAERLDAYKSQGVLMWDANMAGGLSGSAEMATAWKDAGKTWFALQPARTPGTNVTGTPWEGLEYTEMNPTFRSQWGGDSVMGPEYGFGYMMEKKGWLLPEGDSLGVIKASRDGGGNSNWVRGDSLETAAKGYQTLLNSIKVALGKAREDGYSSITIDGLMYLQGESNSGAEVTNAASRYQQLLADLKADLKTAGYDESMLKFAENSVLGEHATWRETSTSVGDEGNSGNTHVLLENLAAGNDDIGFVHTRDLGKITSGDSMGVHYSGESQLTIGARYAYAFAVQNNIDVGAVRGDNDEVALDQAGAWWMNRLPDAAAVAVWDLSSVSTPNPANLMLGRGNYITQGATLTVGGIRVEDVYNQLVTIKGGTIALGAQGIVLQNGGLDVSSDINVTASQTWTTRYTPEGGAAVDNQMTATGTITIADGVTLTLAANSNLNFNNIIGTGNLVIGNGVTLGMSATDLAKHATGENPFTDGNNGFQQGTFDLITLTGADSTITLSGTLTGADALEGKSLVLSSDRKILQIAGTAAGVYMVRDGIVTYSQAKDIASATVINIDDKGNTGATLMLDQALSQTNSIESTGNGGRISLAQGVTLAQSSLGTLGAAVQLGGSGTLKLSNNTWTRPANLQLQSGASGWTGKVEISGGGNFAGANLGDLANGSYSTILMHGVSGWSSQWNGGSLNCDIELQNDGSTVAWNFNAGASNGTQRITFYGSVSGSGTLMKTANNSQGFEFAGDISGWTGSFVKDGSQTSRLYFSGKANTVNAAISRSNGTLGLNVNTDAVFNANVTGVNGGLVLAAGHTATFKGSTTEISGASSLGGTVYNEHSMTLGGSVAVTGSMEMYERYGSEGTNTYSGEGAYAGSGYLTSSTAKYYLVKGGANSSLTADGLSVTGVASHTIENNNILVTFEADNTIYHINSNLAWGDAMGADTTSGVVVAKDAELTLSALATKTITGPGTVKIACATTNESYEYHNQTFLENFVGTVEVARGVVQLGSQTSKFANATLTVGTDGTLKGWNGNVNHRFVHDIILSGGTLGAAGNNMGYKGAFTLTADSTVAATHTTTLEGTLAGQHKLTTSGNGTVKIAAAGSIGALNATATTVVDSDLEIGYLEGNKNVTVNAGNSLVIDAVNDGDVTKYTQTLTNSGMLTLGAGVQSLSTLVVNSGATLALTQQGDDAVAISNLTMAAGSALDVSSLFRARASQSGQEDIILAKGVTSSSDWSAVRLLSAPEDAVLSLKDSNLVLTMAAPGGNDLIWDNASASGMWSTSDNNWHTAAASGTHVPFTSESSVRFTSATNGQTVTLAGATTAGSITIEEGADIAISDGGNTLSGTLKGEGTLVINSALNNNASTQGLPGGSLSFDSDGWRGTVQVNGGVMDVGASIQKLTQDGSRVELRGVEGKLGGNNTYSGDIVLTNTENASALKITASVSNNTTRLTGKITGTGDIERRIANGNSLSFDGDISGWFGGYYNGGKAGDFNSGWNNVYFTYGGEINADFVNRARTAACHLTLYFQAASTVNGDLYFMPAQGYSTSQALNVNVNADASFNGMVKATTFTVSAGSKATLNGQSSVASLGGTGTLEVGTGGTLSLTSANTGFTGSLQVDKGGTLGFSGSNALRATNITVEGGSVFDLANVIPTEAGEIILATATGSLIGPGDWTSVVLKHTGGVSDYLYTLGSNGQSIVLTLSEAEYRIWDGGSNSWDKGDTPHWHDTASGTLSTKNFADGDWVRFDSASSGSGTTAILGEDVHAGRVKIDSGVTVNLDTNSHSLTADAVSGTGATLVKQGAGTAELDGYVSLGTLYAKVGTVNVSAEEDSASTIGTIKSDSGTTIALKNVTAQMNDSGKQTFKGNLTVGENAVVNVVSDDRLDYSASNTITINQGGEVNFNDSGRWTVHSGNKIVLNGGNITGSGQGENGALDFDGSGNVLRATADSEISANLRLRNNITEFSVENVDTTLTLSGIIYKYNNAAGLQKTGDGTLLITGDNRISGAVTVNAGTLVAGSANALGTGAVTLNNGGELELTSTVLTSGALTVNSGATLTFARENNLVSIGAINITGGAMVDVTALGMLDRTQSYTLASGTGVTAAEDAIVILADRTLEDYAQVINRDNKLVLTFSENPLTKNLIWDGSSDYWVADGSNTHWLRPDGTLVAFANRDYVRFDSRSNNKTVTLGTDVTAGSVTTDNGVAVTLGTNGHNLTANGDSTLSTLELNGTGSTARFNGDTTVTNLKANGTGSIVAGMGTITVTNTAQDQGVRVESGKELSITAHEVDATNVWNSGSLVVGDGVNATLIKTTHLVNGNMNNQGTTSLEIKHGATVAVSGGDNEGNTHLTGLVLSEWENTTAATVSGKLLAQNATLLSGNTKAFTLNINNGGVVAVKGIKSKGSRGYEVNLNDGGTLVFGGTTSTNNGGTLNAAAGSTIGISADAASYNRNIVTTAADGKIVTFDTGKYQFNADGTDITRAADAAGGTFTLTGNLTGTAAVQVEGPGRLVLDGTGTQTVGAMTVASGTLVLNSAGGLTSTGTLSLGSGAVLEMGSAAGTITAGSLNLGNDSTVRLTGFGMVSTVGGLTLGSNVTLDLSSISVTDEGEYVLIAASSLMGSADDVQLLMPDLDEGWFQYGVSVKDNDLVLSVMLSRKEVIWDNAGQTGQWLNGADANWHKSNNPYSHLAFADGDRVVFERGASLALGSDVEANRLTIKNGGSVVISSETTGNDMTVNNSVVGAGCSLTLKGSTESSNEVKENVTLANLTLKGGKTTVGGYVDLSGNLSIDEKGGLTIGGLTYAKKVTIGGNSNVELGGGVSAGDMTVTDSAVTIGADSTLASLALTGSTLENNSTLQVSDLYLQKSIEVAGESHITGSGTTTAEGVTLAAGSHLTIDGGQTLRLASEKGIVGGAGREILTLDNASLATSQSSWTIAASVEEVNLKNTATLDVRGGTLTVDTTMTGSGALQKTGVGTLHLTHANTYTGDTVLDGGSVLLSHKDGLGSGNVVINSGAMLELDRATLADAVTIDGNLTLNRGGAVQLLPQAQGGNDPMLNVTGTMTMGTDSVLNLAHMDIRMGENTYKLVHAGEITNDGVQLEMDRGVHTKSDYTLRVVESGTGEDLVLTYDRYASRELIWDGGSDTWNNSNAHWHASGDTELGTQAFSLYDNVTFDGTGAAAVATIGENVHATNMTITAGDSAESKNVVTVNTNNKTLTVDFLNAESNTAFVKTGGGTANIGIAQENFGSDITVQDGTLNVTYAGDDQTVTGNLLRENGTINVTVGEGREATHVTFAEGTQVQNLNALTVHDG
ncbi:MAG: sialate O-acetylesterase, partial [Akkermansia sp.]|nr:sialate O-acetylesterase [Akkermansia sp.]